jgi:carbon storage regulator CsrA
VLVFTRTSTQSLMIGDDIEIAVLSVLGQRVTLGIRAPRHLLVLRSEMVEAGGRGTRRDDAGTGAEVGRQANKGVR